MGFSVDVPGPWDFAYLGDCSLAHAAQIREEDWSRGKRWVPDAFNARWTGRGWIPEKWKFGWKDIPFGYVRDDMSTNRNQDLTHKNGEIVILPFGYD